MYVYDIGYHSYEESEYTQLYHKKKFSDNEFEEKVIRAVVSVIKGYKIRKGEHISFQDISYGVVDELIKNFGFHKVKFVARYNVFGWANILDDVDWGDTRGEELNRLTEAVKKSIKLKKTKHSEVK